MTDVGEISAAYDYLDGALVAKYWDPDLHCAYWSTDDDDSPFHLGCGCGRPAVAGLRETLSPPTSTRGERNTDGFFALGGTSLDLVRLQEAVVGGLWSRR